MDDFESLKQAYLEAMLSGGYRECFSLISQALESDRDVKSIYEKVFKPSLYEVGLLWEKNLISVAKEHLATAITEKMMNSIFGEMLSVDRVKKRVVAFNSYGESHKVGLKMVCDVFESHGWDGVYLGTITRDALPSKIETINPDLVCISMTLKTSLGNLALAVGDVKGQDSGLKIVLGGQGISEPLVETLSAKHSGIYHVLDLYELDSILTKNKRDPFN